MAALLGVVGDSDTGNDNGVRVALAFVVRPAPVPVCLAPAGQSDVVAPLIRNPSWDDCSKRDGPVEEAAGEGP